MLVKHYLTPFLSLDTFMDGELGEGVHYTPAAAVPDRGRPPKKRLKIIIKFFINYVKTVAL